MAAVGGSNPVPRWQRLSLDTAIIVLLVSGSLWLLFHYLFGAGNQEIGLPHWSESWLMRLHGLATFATLVTVGAFLPLHVPRGWRTRSQRRLEVTMLTCLALVVITAYCLYYFAPDWLRPALGWLHAGLGCAWGATILVHRGKR